MLAIFLFYTSLRRRYIVCVSARALWPSHWHSSRLDPSWCLEPCSCAVLKGGGERRGGGGVSRNNMRRKIVSRVRESVSVPPVTRFMCACTNLKRGGREKDVFPFRCLHAQMYLYQGVGLCVSVYIHTPFRVSQRLSQNASSRQQSLMQMRLCLYHVWFAAKGQKGTGGMLLMLSSSEKRSTGARKKKVSRESYWSEWNSQGEEILAWFAPQSAERHQKLAQSQGQASEADIDTSGVIYRLGRVAGEWRNRLTFKPHCLVERFDGFE